jgi:hypothetical protein
MDSEHPTSKALLNFLESEIALERALGDYQTMLRALWNKREDPTIIQPTTKLPKGYRSLAVREYVRQNFGALLRYWGPTAIRGDLTEKKAHISRFIELVNDVFIIVLRDFCLTILAEIVSSKGISSEQSIHRVLDVYNRDFCDLIQNDPTLRIEY